MNTPLNAMPESPLGAQAVKPAVMSETRPLYWSIRHELWENRSICIAPLAVAAVYLFGFLISLFWVPRSMRGMGAHEPLPPVNVLAMPYSHAAMLIMLIALLVGIFYSLDALHSERRDRSILFWKSLPVSDLTTVLSKASIPLMVLPLLTFAIIVATQWIMLLLSSAVLLATGRSVATLWRQLPWFQMSLMLLYHLLAVHALYYAPIYGWLLLVSGWARRAAFLWAGLPLVAICVVEKIAFNTSHFAAMLQSRLSGGPEAGDFPVTGVVAIHPLTHLAPLHFLSSPGLWLGLLFAAAFIAAAVRLRRYRGPI